MLPFFKLRSLKNNRDGVTNILGYIFSLTVAAMLMVNAVFIFNGVIDEKTTEVAKIEAQNIANYVANAIAEAVSIKQAMPEAHYYKTLDLPSRIAGKKYTIDVTETEVHVRTADGNVNEICSTYTVEGQDSGIVPTIIRNEHDKITISYDEIDYIFKFDFGKGNILSHSPVEAGYYMVSPEDGPDWYQDVPYRIPIKITNPSNKELENVPVKIILNETNFDYERVTYGSGNLPGGYTNIGSGTPQPDLLLYDPELMIENEINITASVDPPIWYPYWRHSSIRINDIGPFADPDDIMEIEKDTFKVILKFADNSSGPDSTYVWHNATDEPPLHPITFGSTVGSKVDCISYTENYLDIYTGMAEFYIEDAFTTLSSYLADGSKQNIVIEGYFLDKTKFSISCNITIKYGDIYVIKGGGGDYENIQDAIDNAKSGQTIFVHGDTYNEQLNIDKNINLVGASWRSTIDGNGINDYVVKVKANVNDAVIHSFDIKNGATGNDIDETDGLELDGCSNVIVTDCEIKENHGRGIVVYNGANKNIIRECTSRNNKGHKEDGEIRDGDALVITDDYNNYTEYNYVSDSDFYNCNNYDSDGIVIKNGADYNKVESCYIYTIGGDNKEDWSKGIDIVNKEVGCDGPSNNVIKDCDISDVSGNYIAGIGIWNIPDNNGEKNPTNNKIIGGNIHDIKGLGITLYSADYNTVKDIKIHDNYGGIWTLDSNHNTIENCDIYSNTDHSIWNPLLPQSKNCGDGIYFDLFSGNNTVRYCNIYGNEGVGIYIADVYEENPSDNNIIEYCNIYSNKGNLIKNGAVLLSFASNTIVRYCNIYNNIMNGLSINFGDKTQNDQNIIYKNNFYNNQKNGITLLAGTRKNNISHNNFYWNNEYGVKIFNVLLSGYNKINNNNFVNNNGVEKEAFDGTLTDDDWANNYWEGHPLGQPYDIPGIGGDEDPTPQNMFSPEIIVLDESGKNFFQNIQDAIDNVQTNGIVKVTGTFTVSTPIFINKSLKLISNDATIVYNGLDAAIKIYSAGVEIDSFNIIGPNDAKGIRIFEGESVIINNCEIFGFDNGIDISDNGVRITNCIVYSNTNGIYIYGVDNNQILNCKFYDNMDGIELIKVGIEIPDNNDIIDCDFDNNNNGIHLDGANLNMIKHCEFERNTEGGVLIDGNSEQNTIKKCMFKENDCGVSIETGSKSNNIFYNHFIINSQNANDANTINTNFWDDGLNRGNYWDDYFGLDTNYDGIGDAPNYYNIPGGSNKDNYPIASSGIYVESLRPYSIEYWNPSGESIILVSMDLKPKETKFIYIYYGSEDLDSTINTGLNAIAVNTSAFKKCGIFEKGQKDIFYQIPPFETPEEIEGTHTKNEILYVAESRLMIKNSSKNKNQVNMILLSQDPENYSESYLVSIHIEDPNLDNDFFVHKKNSSEQELNSVSLPKSIDNWLLLRSYIYLSKNCYTVNDNSTHMNFVNISSFIYDYTTYANLGSISYQQVNVLEENPYLDGWIGIGCGLLNNPAISNGKIIVDWFRIRKAPLIPPIVNIGSMESKNCRWISSDTVGTDYNKGTPFKPGPVLRDYNCGSSFGIEELPKGTYTITVSSGLFMGNRDEMTVIISPDYSTFPPTGIASIFFPETAEGGEFETRSTTFDWPGGFLEIGFYGCECNIPGFFGGGIINSITLARGKNGVRLLNRR